MKYRRVWQKSYALHDSWWVEILFGLFGFFIYGIIGAVVGAGVSFVAMFVMGSEWPTEASELEWSDIELAIDNYAKCFVPGVGGIKFICKDRVFVFEKRNVFQYTEGKQFVVWYKTGKWEDILGEKDDAFFSELCGKAPVRDVDWDTNKTFLIPQQAGDDAVIEVCQKLVRHFIGRSEAMINEIASRERVYFASIWIDPQYQEVSPVPIVLANFKGKKDGRPVLYLPDRKGYWILHEDGELEQFVDFESWLKCTG